MSVYRSGPSLTGETLPGRGDAEELARRIKARRCISNSAMSGSSLYGIMSSSENRFAIMTALLRAMEKAAHIKR
jgi:hypothetical protein